MSRSQSFYKASELFSSEIIRHRNELIRYRGINFLNVIDFFWDACIQKKILYSCDYTRLKMLKNVRKLYLIDKMFLFFSTIWKIKELYFWNSVNSFLKRTLERSIFKNLNLENYYIKRYFALWNFCFVEIENNLEEIFHF